MTQDIAQRAKLTENKPSAWAPEYNHFLTYVRTLQFMKQRFRDTGDDSKLVHISQKEIETRFFIYPKHDRKKAIQQLIESGELEQQEAPKPDGKTYFLYGTLKHEKVDLSLIAQPDPPKEDLFRFMANCLNDVSLKEGVTSTPYFDLFLQNKNSFLYHFFRIDNFSNRVHTPVTNLHRTIRPDLLLKGEKTNSFDVATMQPLLLGKILLNEIGENEYSKWINQGVDIYLKLQETAKLSTRDEAKKRFFEILFSPPSDELLQMFGASDWITWINDYKGRQLAENPHNKEKRYSNLAWLLQTTEVRLMRKVWNLLFFYKISFLSIHDEIIIMESDSAKAEGLFHSVLKTEFQYYKLNRKEPQPEVLEVDLIELENYLKIREFEPDEYQLSQSETTTDIKKTLLSEIAILKTNPLHQPTIKRINKIINLKISKIYKNGTT